jgi:nucleoside-diphosphate-sugar epimerase
VIHIASPFPSKDPKNEEDILRPAIDGTLNVLKACRKCCVEKVVLTSSIAAITTNLSKKGGIYNEND